MTTTLAQRAETALRIVREAPIIAYDVETSGIEWQINHPVGYVITAPEISIYVPIRHGGGGNLASMVCPPLESPTGRFVRHPFEEALAEAFVHRRSMGSARLTVGHNLGFDMQMSANAGIYLGRHCEDTQLNEAMLDEYARSYSLDRCCIEWKVTPKLGDDLYKHIAASFGGDDGRKSMEHFWRLSGTDPLGVDYAEGDGISTLALRAVQIEKIRDEELETIHRVESQLIWTVFKMERKGIKVDATRFAEVRKQLKHQIEEARLQLPVDFNPRSGAQVRAIMEAEGHTDWPMTAPSSKFPEGQPSFTEKWLKKNTKGRAIVDVRRLTNLENSFLDPLEQRHIFNGRVHAQLNQLKSDEYGTVAGRFSCSSPNLQQVPKRDKELGPLYRSIFVPDDGMEFVEADYSQCEPRLFAHYSAEPALVDGYNASPPLDMHSVVAQNLIVERDPTAKRMNMGILTGMQVPTFAVHMGYDMSRAQEEFDRWFSLFPGIKQFQDKARILFRQTGFVKTILGRRCRLDHARFAYRATSRIIQGSNADIIKYKILECDRYIEDCGLEKDIQLLMTVHDSLEWQNSKTRTGRDASRELIKICCDVQSSPFNLRVPFIMDVGVGPNWSVATYGDKNKEID